MTLTTDDLSQIRTIVQQETQTIVDQSVRQIVQEEIQPVKDEVQALRSDVKEIYDSMNKAGIAVG